jgi:pimeloyl-ACP methyl ester carboxylesterase
VPRQGRPPSASEQTEAIVEAGGERLDAKRCAARGRQLDRQRDALLVIPSGGLNSTVAGLATRPFNPFDELKGEFRVIAADLRNAKGGQSSGPIEVNRRWDAYTDDHIGLMDHLGIREFMVLGFCIGGPFIWNLLKRAGDRVVAAVPAQPNGYRPEMLGLSYNKNMKG